MAAINFSKLIPWKHLVSFLAGMALLIYLIYSLGAGEIGAQLSSIGWTYLSVFVISFFYLFLQTLAWHVTITEGHVSFWGLFRIKISMEALNAFLPFSLIKGESIGAQQLRDRFGILSGSIPIITDRSIRTLALFLFISIGFIVGFLNLTALHPLLRLGIPALTVLKLLICGILIKKSTSGFYTVLLSKCPQFSPCASPASLGQHYEMDLALKAIYENKRGNFYQALLLHLLSYGLLVVEIYLIGSTILPEFNPAMALTLTAIIPFITMIFYFLPGSFGVREGILVGLIGLIVGAPAALAGVTIELVRRARTLFWVIIGFGLTGNPFKMFLK